MTQEANRKSVKSNGPAIRREEKNENLTITLTARVQVATASTQVWQNYCDARLRQFEHCR